MLFRSLQRKRFGRGPLSLLCRLGPHLRRSIDTNWTIARRAQRTSISEAVLSHLPSAVVVCRADGQVVFVNAAAKRLLSRADGITSRDGYIGQPTFERQRRLHKLIAETCRAGARHIDALVVSRPSKRRTMTLIVRALTGAPSGGNAQACGHALMVVAENDIALGCAGDLLQHSFGLTRAEVRLMDAMLYGGSLPDIALKLGVSHSTVRTQMRSLFDKTGTHRQNELIKLILRVHAAPLHEVDPGTHEMQEAL